MITRHFSFIHSFILLFDAEMAQTLPSTPRNHQPPPPPQQQIINNSVSSQANTRRLNPNLPDRSLVEGPRENYLKIGVPLYEASIRCNWNAAKAILDAKRDLVRVSITDHGETALHVAASAKADPKDTEEFVRELVDMMEKEDLALENENFNTALYLAAAAGNLETVKIMMKKNKILQTIPGASEMLPLYAAALFGHHEVVKYLFEQSNELRDDCWKPQNRGWLLEKCVENDMFDIALEIVKTYPDLGSTGTILGVLAGKPDAFGETNSNIIGKTIKLSKRLYSLMFFTHQASENKHPEPHNGSAPKDLAKIPEASHETKSNIIRRTVDSVFTFIGSKVGAHEKENQALPLLRIIWNDIAKKHKKKIDTILRGPLDSVKQDKSASGRMVQAIQLTKLISEQLDKMESETQIIIEGKLAQDTNQNSAKVDRVLQLKNLISEYVVNMHTESQKILKQENMPVVGTGDQALVLQKIISKHIVNMHDESQDIIKRETRKEDQAKLLQRLISKNIAAMRHPTLNVYSSRVLFIAAEKGNTTFLVELIRQYPDLIWKVNDNGLSIFHIAVKYRHEGIYNLLYEIGAMKDLITPMRDERENNMLHLAGTRAKQKQLEDVSGVALQMQRELLWFQEVEKMIPPSYRERKNKDGLTPHELFTMEHKELVSQGEKWMKGTASQCMVVAALIATIVFAAAFTVPGGYDQNNGVPIFHSKATFIVFVVADAVSLVSSSASILIFLSILTSRYAESDFLESLPKKLISGLLTLFLSVTTMTIAFGVSFFVLYHKGVLWIPIMICVFGVLPVLLYISLQYGLFFDVIRSTYGSRYLFKPKKHILYYENPKAGGLCFATEFSVIHLREMFSPMNQTLDDNDLDDEALWAVIDSAAAASASSSSALTSATRSLKPQNNNNNRFHSPKVTFPIVSKFASSSPSSNNTTPRKHLISNGEVLLPEEESSTGQRPKKIARFSLTEATSPPPAPLVMSPVNCSSSDGSVMTHCLSGRFPAVDLFKEYQNAAMAILEKGDYTMISGNPFIKKSGWRKISFYFNISYEIKDKTIEFDDNRNVQRAEFIVRAHMQGGRFSDGWGSCDRREKRFMKANHDIPSTAETRAKNKACQDLLGIGEYRPGVNAQR
ncbi:hypothetical protein SSX86_026591 [Deinandra increscens subsp. villosa]|uniref:PGG domain-containing protein n=1 Tax=Deinandra increscens subsp. villosa TaxID=3103831 RepID=A0AAP0CLE7_9ASTR